MASRSSPEEKRPARSPGASGKKPAGRGSRGAGAGEFPYPMLPSELAAGWIWLPIHAVLLPYGVSWLGNILTGAGWGSLDAVQLNLLYYLISFLFVLVFLFRFLRETFADLTRHLMETLQGVVLGYVAAMAGTAVVSLLISWVTGGLTNPNNDAVFQAAVLNPNVMKAVAVLLAPVVEEALFRGVVFGSIRKHSRLLAYVVTVLFFAVYHLWHFLVSDPSWTTVLYLLQYVPATLALCWCYEKGKNLWGCIFLHMLVNLVSLTVSLL